MSDVFCKQCGVTDDQQAKCDDGCGVFCQECDAGCNPNTPANSP
jgi:hypothetical protein